MKSSLLLLSGSQLEGAVQHDRVVGDCLLLAPDISIFVIFHKNAGSGIDASKIEIELVVLSEYSIRDTHP